MFPEFAWRAVRLVMHPVRTAAPWTFIPAGRDRYEIRQPRMRENPAPTLTVAIGQLTIRMRKRNVCRVVTRETHVIVLCTYSVLAGRRQIMLNRPGDCLARADEIDSRQTCIDRLPACPPQ